MLDNDCRHFYVDTGEVNSWKKVEDVEQKFKCKDCGEEKWFPKYPDLRIGKPKEYFNKQNHAVFKTKKRS